ncbi:MAG: serine hydrolase [Actinomycetota bacterium]|nr:serine hydrolase [Actinomycetota bacterium]
MDTPILALMQEHRARGLQLGSQLVVTHQGNPVFDLADGESSVGQPMTGAHVLRWYEAGMPQLAVLAGRLIERGKLGLNDLVADHIAGWEGGKEDCTVRHLLTHMGGFAGAELGDREIDHPAAIEFIAAYRAEALPGHRAAFHPTSGWRVLAEIVRKVGRGGIAKQLHRHVWRKADMPGAALGLDAASRRRLGAFVGSVHWAGWEATEEQDRERVKVPYRADLIHNLDWHMEKDDPSIGWFGTARDLAAFYDALNSPATPFFKQDSTIDLLTSTHRDGLRDHHFGGAAVPWGLGFQTAGSFGGSLGYRSHGHTGRTGRAMHDPAEGLTVAYMTNGLCRPLDNERRCAEMFELVQDLLFPRPGGAWVTQGLMAVSDR